MFCLNCVLVLERRMWFCGCFGLVIDGMIVLRLSLRYLLNMGLCDVLC